MSQNSKILKHLRTIGPITPLEALNLYGCFRLGARICDLRELGHEIVTDLIDVAGKHGDSRVAKYRLKGEV